MKIFINSHRKETEVEQNVNTEKYCMFKHAIEQ